MPVALLSAVAGALFAHTGQGIALGEADLL
jgi:hypothetical protein